ncbi:MAG TPA: rhodanese-related sulfurtransferase [Geminocystis sp. M7585_C2015_104]|nr:rhodanese-related sulfurtransferase [Geminocystis sp. M7585_C2015_104]
MNLTLASFYRFLPLENLRDLQEKMLTWCNQEGIRGTILLASEGINANIVGERQKLDVVIDQIKKILNCEDIEVKYAPVTDYPFRKMKVKIKREIITFGPGANPNERVGIYVAAKDWNDLISQPDVKVIDTRNEYEVKIGTFKGAINPHIHSFRQLREYIEKNLEPQKDTKIAMFCTGGIRCEKATAYMLNRGFKEVYHLKGGILKYLEEIPPEKSLWEGECFVFDDRVAVKHGLEKGSYKLDSKTGNPIPIEG